MLLLSRQIGEEVLIIKDGQVLGTVCVTHKRGCTFRIGFSFPPDMQIHRREVWEEITGKRPKRENPGPGWRESQRVAVSAKRERHVVPSPEERSWDQVFAGDGGNQPSADAQGKAVLA